jgi:uncharacterized RDD family membrane protein YckC
MQYQTQYVGVWRRAVAVVLDLIIIGSLTGPIWLNSAFFAPSTQTTTTSGTVTEVVQFAASPWTGLLIAAIPFIYFTLLEGFFGATAGKMLLGLRVVQLDGSPITWREAIVRNLLRPVDEIVLYLVAAISVWASPRKQRLGDRAADTVVVRRVPVSLQPYVPVAPGAPMVAAGAQPIAQPMTTAPQPPVPSTT